MTNLSEKDVDSYRKFFTETVSEKNETLTEINQLLILTAGHWRAFTSTLLTINIAVVAALLSVIASKGALIQDPTFAKVGILFLTLDAVLIVYYSVEVLYNDDDSLSKRYNFFRDTYDKRINIALEHINRLTPFIEFDEADTNKMKEFSKLEMVLISDAKKREKSGGWLLMLGYLFILGLVFAVLSTIPPRSFNVAAFGHNLCIFFSC
jgi:hypothetical protein